MYVETYGQRFFDPAALKNKFYEKRVTSEDISKIRQCVHSDSKQQIFLQERTKSHKAHKNESTNREGAHL